MVQMAAIHGAKWKQGDAGPNVSPVAKIIVANNHMA